MKKTSFHMLRIGLGVTFVWIGILILKQPEAFGGYIQLWAAKLLFVPLEETMMYAAVFDILIGFLFLVGWFNWLAGFLGAAHLAVVLVVSGITDITVRDVGLLAGSLAVMVDALPASIISKLKLSRKPISEM